MISDDVINLVDIYYFSHKKTQNFSFYIIKEKQHIGDHALPNVPIFSILVGTLWIRLKSIHVYSKTNI